MTINILPMSDSLDFDQSPLAKDVVHHAIVAKPNSITVLRAGQLFDTLGKWIRAECCNLIHHSRGNIGW